LVNEENFDEFVDLASRVQTHNCEKARYRCHKRKKIPGNIAPEKTEWVCRFPKRPQSHSYGYQDIAVEHSAEAKAILVDCGLATVNGNDTTYHEALRSGKHVYPASKTEHFSPMNSKLFGFLRGSMNILICSTYFAARYLAKYAAGVEERTKLKFVAGGTEDE
ncbi:hypothetical protein FOL47_005308, partial [Perkinsus chesapeaki]